jgi:hypothetical protein
MNNKKEKNFFPKSQEQRDSLQEIAKEFGADKVSFLDAVVGGAKPTSPQYIEVYAESTYVRRY